jgi:hypothetical protein
LNLCVLVLLPSLAFLSIKPLKVIQKSYKTQKPESAVFASQANAKRAANAAQNTPLGIVAHIDKDKFGTPGESKSVNRGAAHGNRHRGECPGEFGV